MDSYNFMTPTSETETRYYWFQLRNIRPDDAELSKMMSELKAGSGYMGMDWKPNS